MHILFICSRNQWRSPTAEAIYRNHPGLQVKSAGTEPSARIRVNASMIQWADMIFVMEQKHQIRLMEKFEGIIHKEKIIVLDIEDEYQLMDEELIEEIKAIVDPYLDKLL